MSRTAGSINVKTSATLRSFSQYVDKYNIDPMELLFQAVNGKIRGIPGKLLGQTTKQEAIAIRLTAAKELMPYGYAKLASVKHVIEKDSELRLAWEVDGQHDLFDDALTGPEVLAKRIDAL